jgi:branched-chain amino acid transport system substrate-binding protein
MRSRSLALRTRFVLVLATVALLTAAAGSGQSADAPFRIGVLVDCTGIGAETHDWSLAAAELPLLAHGGRLAGKGPASGVRGAKVAGRRVELVEGCSESGVYGRLITETRQLVELDHVDAVVGAFGWSDGVVFRELARRYPTVPFVLAGSFAREATSQRPASNLYRFTPDIEQEQAGLATYAYRTLGWRTAATVAEQTPNGWGATAAFAAEFCALGGQVQRVWTPACGAGGPLLRSVPPGVDGVMVLAHYGYGSPAAFIRAYLARHPDAPRSLLLSVWLYPPAELPAYASLWPQLHGVVARIAGVPDPSSARDVAYRRAFATAFPGLPASVAGNLLVLPYSTAVEAVLQSLEQTRGDPGADRARLRSALALLHLATPGGPIRLDRNRQAVASATLVRFDGTTPGTPSFHPVRTIPAVDETLGGLFAAGDSPSPARNDCRRATPPPWAR